MSSPSCASRTTCGKPLLTWASPPRLAEHPDRYRNHDGNYWRDTSMVERTDATLSCCFTAATFP